MLRLATVLEVKKLLSQGVSQRKIARTLGIGRATVGAIASGKRGIYGRDEASEEEENDDQWPVLTGDFVRCPECGAKVLLPCMSCYAHRYRRRELPMQNRAAQNKATQNRAA